jgi:hypothetical protein
MIRSPNEVKDQHSQQMQQKKNETDVRYKQKIVDMEDTQREFYSKSKQEQHQ